MKKIKKITILIAAAVFACGAFAVSACNSGSSGEDGSSGEGGVKVNVSEWQKRLTLESFDNFTIKDNKYDFNIENNKYELEGTLEYKVDKKNQVIYEQTYAVDGSTLQKFDVFEYTFAYKDKYYSCVLSSEYNDVSELTKEEFDGYFFYTGTDTNLPEYEQFEYDNETCTYQSTQDIDSAGLRISLTNKVQFFKDGGFKIETEAIYEMSETLQRMKEEVYAEQLNSTTVTVPQQAYKAVDDYLANKNNN